MIMGESRNAILLDPSAEWRDLLLASGARVACKRGIHDVYQCGWMTATGAVAFDDGALFRGDAPALVLAWEGCAVAEGCDRALRVLGVREGYPATWRAPRLVESTNGDCLILWPATGKGGTYYGKNAVPLGCAHDTLVIQWRDPGRVGEEREAYNLATVCAARGMGKVIGTGRNPP